MGTLYSSPEIGGNHEHTKKETENDPSVNIVINFTFNFVGIRIIEV